MVGPAPKPLHEGTRKNVDALLAIHADLSAQGGGVVVLGGPRGVGKALALSELRKHLAVKGGLVLFGRAEAAATHAYAALREPAQQALAFLETRGMAEEFLDAHARALAVLLPSLSSSAPRARDRTSFLEALRALFLDLSRHGPVSLLLSDLHAADEDTKGAVRFLAQHLYDPDVGDDEGFRGVLFIGARTDDPEGAAYARALTAGKRGRIVEVGGLSKEQLLQYLSTHPLLDRLLSASRGRPEDVDELLESLPRDTDALLLQRIAALDPVARKSLAALAVLGRPAPADLLAAIVAHKTADVAHALGHLVEQRLLARRLQNGELLFGFARQHHQEVIAQNLVEGEREALHNATAAALEARSPGGSAGGVGDGTDQLLAFHFLRGNQPQRGVPYAVRACEQLLLTFAYGTAVDLATRALKVATVDERFALLGHLSEAQRLRGDLREAQRAAEEMKVLVVDSAAGESAGAEHAEARQLPMVLRRIGEILSLRGEHRDALTTLEQAEAALKDDGDGEALPEKAQLSAAMAEACYALRDLDAGVRHAEEAMARAPNAPVAFQLRVSNTLGKIAFARERFDDAERRFQDNLRRAEENGLDHEAVLARINAGLAKHRRGEVNEARELLEKALIGARAIGDLQNEAFALSNIGTILQRTDDVSRTLESYQAALARFARLGNRTELRRVTWNLANLYCALGHYGAAQTYLEQSRHFAEADDSDRGRAFVHLGEGDLAFNQAQPGAALLAYDKARELFLRLGETSRVVEAATKAAWCAVQLGDVALAERRVGELPPPIPGTLEAARRLAVEGAILASGSVSGGGGDNEQAARGLAMLSTAVDELERLRARDHAWRTLAFLAERFEQRGDLRSRDAAQARARAMIERQAEELTPSLREHMLLDPGRAAVLGRAVVESSVDEDAGGNGVAVDDARASALPHAALPATRRPEWDARYPELVGTAPALLRVFDRLDRISKTKSATVLVRGESGTGKELVAAAVHRLSDRKAGPFVRVNCAALVETLLMSELFGHEKGSFTGALARKIGRFELARGGTIFLDEIGDISPKTQVSLLRVLQERQFERVGGTQTITTDASVVCATHRDLESMVKEGSFREDLYYRLRGVVVEMPALRERPEDVPLLATRFLAKVRDEVGRGPVSLSPEAEQVLMRYRFPGNIRELQNVIRSVALFCEGDVVEVEHLAEFPELFSAPAARSAQRAPSSSTPRAAAPRPPSQAPARPSPRPSSLPSPSSSPSSSSSGVGSSAVAASSVSVAARDHEPLPTEDDVMRRVEEGVEGGVALGDLKRRLEFEAIANAMRQTGGNITRAAALLRMKRPRLSQIVNGNPELKAIKEQSREDEDE